MSLRIYEDLQQGSEQWFEVRRGLVTASVVGKLLTIGSADALSVDCHRCSATVGHPCLSITKKAPTPIKTLHDARTDLAADLPPVIEPADNETSRALTDTLVAERIAGFVEDSPMNSDMWRGVESEPVARDLYSAHYASAVEVGFMVEDRWGFPIGYSPDGLVGDDGLIEVKAPRSKTQVRAVLNDEVPAYNMAQLQGGLLVSGRAWVDFIPYVGGLPLWKKRVYPDQDWAEAIVAAVAKFEKAAAQMVADYRERVAGLPTTERIDFNNVELKLA